MTLPDDPAERQLVAYNARDVERFVVCYSDDIVAEDGVGARILTGRAALRERYAKMFADFPNLHCEVTTRIYVGPWILHEESITGRASSPEHVVAIYRVQGDVITHVRFLRET